MSDIVPQKNEADIVEPVTRCRYCGATLYPGFYFCAVCATPYKNFELLLPRGRPPIITDGELIERRAPGVWNLFFVYLGALLASFVACLVLWGPRHFELWIVLQSAVIFVVTCVYAALRWPSLAVQFKRFGFLHPAAWIGIVALGPMLAANWAWSEFLRNIVPWDTTELDFHLGLGAKVFFICVLPAILEETAFRGLVQHWLQAAIAPWKAMVVASALFTALHFSLVGAPYIFALSMLLGWVKCKTGSLYPSMAMHFLHNFVVVAFLWPMG